VLPLEVLAGTLPTTGQQFLVAEEGTIAG